MEETSSPLRKSNNGIEPSCFPIYANNSEILPTMTDFWRAGHSMDLIGSNLYVFGGYNGPNELYILNNAQNIISGQTEAPEFKWDKAEIGGIRGRAGHFSFSIGSKLYIYGGYVNFSWMLGDLFEIDLETDEYKAQVMEYKGLALNVERRWHCGTFLNNRLFVHGGWNDSGPLDDVLMLPWEWLADGGVICADTMKWEKVEFKGSVPSARRWHVMTQMPSNTNQYIIFGGYDGDKDNLLKDLYIMDLGMHCPYFGELIPCAETQSSFEPRTKDAPIWWQRGKQQNIVHTSNRCHTEYFATDCTDDMSWKPLEKVGQIFSAIRSAHKAVRIGEHGILVGGGYVSDYVEPFYFMDTRMLKL